MEKINHKDQFPVAIKTMHSFTNRLENTSKLAQQIIWFIFFTFMIRSLLKSFLKKGGSGGAGMGLGPESGMLKSKAKKFTLESNIQVSFSFL